MSATAAPRVAGVAALAAFALAMAAAVWLLASRSQSAGASASARAAARSAFTERTGVQVVRVAVTGGGGIVDLRYRVVDPDKAPIVHDRRARAAIVDESTGQSVDQPFMGHRMKPRRMRAGAVYNHLFVNRQGLIKPGGRVSVLLGGARLDDVLVR